MPAAAAGDGCGRTPVAGSKWRAPEGSSKRMTRGASASTKTPRCAPSGPAPRLTAVSVQLCALLQCSRTAAVSSVCELEELSADTCHRRLHRQHRQPHSHSRLHQQSAGGTQRWGQSAMVTGSACEGLWRHLCAQRVGWTCWDWTLVFVVVLTVVTVRSIFFK
jgi:hypothetical protein